MKDSKFRIDYEELKYLLHKILVTNGFDEDKAGTLSKIFVDNNVYGKDSHGLNRFPSFIDSLKKSVIDIEAIPEKVKKFQALEQWDGHLGAGPLNASFSTNRAIELADKFGIGCVALRNSNHWMRGGTYGWRAAEQGYFFICWSNTKPNMPAWGSSEPRLGNNPLIIAVPGQKGPIVLDMAMSQYSYGSMEVQSKKDEELPYDGGYDEQGKLTKNPDDIIASQRPLPAGLWKGAGLALVLDLMAALLSNGKSTKDIGKESEEFGLSQVFIAISPKMAETTETINQVVDEIITDYKKSQNEDGSQIYYPGERSIDAYKERMDHGILVNENVWKEIKRLAAE